MAGEGVELLADLDLLAVMGVAEVLSSLPRLLALRRRVRRFLVREDVDLFLPIDYPGFNVPVAGWAHRRGIPVLYYIAPQVWAWRPGRTRHLAEATDLVCTVLPFERDFLERYGVRARFVGHPLLDARPPAPSTPREPGAPVLGLFPGSRVQEVERMLPLFLEAAAALREAMPGLRVLVARAHDLPDATFAPAGAGDVLPAGDVLGRATAALTKSGTITLQLALADVPMVVAHRVNPLTYAIARRLVTVEHVALVNLVVGERLVPELVQDEAEPERLARSLRPLLDPGDPARARMLDGLARVRARLGEPGGSARVAEAALELLAERAG
jgi:lipid-A-disaccharide synthase